MSLTRLSLNHFRNFSVQTVEFAPRLTLVVGKNGQGKTNLLEAVFLLLQGRDFRAAAERDAIQRGEETALIEGSGEIGERPQRWRHTIPISGRRTHSGPVVPVVLFSPDDVYLAKGSPDRRRRFLDLLLSAHDSRYARSLRAYTRVVLQRNRALKEAPFQSLVDDFTPLLVREGLYLWKRRQETVEALNPLAAEKLGGFATGEALTMTLQYGGAREPITTEDEYLKILDARRADERTRQTSLVGPHRDDVVMALNGLDTRIYASQGQLRSVALSVKLSTFSWLSQETGVRPVILLDDVLSELDAERRQAVLTQVSAPQQQTIVTDTEPRSYDALDPSIVTVIQGEVHPWNGSERKN